MVRSAACDVRRTSDWCGHHPRLPPHFPAPRCLPLARGARLMEVPCPGGSLNVLHWFAPSFLCPAPPLHLENSMSCPGQKLLLLLGSGMRRHTEPISAEPQLLRTRTNIYMYF